MRQVEVRRDRHQAIFLFVWVDVRFWHLADIPSCTAHVRFREQSGHRRALSKSRIEADGVEEEAESALLVFLFNCQYVTAFGALKCQQFGKRSDLRGVLHEIHGRAANFALRLFNVIVIRHGRPKDHSRE